LERNVPVFKGAASRRNLGTVNEAVKFIIEASREYGKIQILATGPLTNIAKATLVDGELVDRVERIVIMGGVFHPHDVIEAVYLLRNDLYSAKKLK